MDPVKYDEIGYWSQVKLDIVQKYAMAYSKIMSKTPEIKRYIYIDAFSGPGVHISKNTGVFIPGSPINALSIVPKFSEYHFIDLDGNKVAELGRNVGERTDVIFHKGDCNELLLSEVFPRCQYKDYHRALCLLDPYSLNVDWRVLKTAGDMKSIEIFYNFMIMDANMNLFLRDPQKIAPEQATRMDKVWGDSSWRTSAYKKRPGLFEEYEEKECNEAIAEAFRKRLEKEAGFKYVPKPIPMRNSKGAVVYYLYFASPNSTGGRIVSDIFNTYRDWKS